VRKRSDVVLCVEDLHPTTTQLVVEFRQGQLFTTVRLAGASKLRPDAAVFLGEVDCLHQVDWLNAASLLTRVVNERRQ